MVPLLLLSSFVFYRWRHQGQAPTASTSPETPSVSSHSPLPPTSAPTRAPTSPPSTTAATKTEGIVRNYVIEVTFNWNLGPNFVTECFFLTLRALHLGFLKTVQKLHGLLRTLKVASVFSSLVCSLILPNRRKWVPRKT